MYLRILNTLIATSKQKAATGIATVLMALESGRTSSAYQAAQALKVFFALGSDVVRHVKINSGTDGQAVIDRMAAAVNTSKEGAAGATVADYLRQAAVDKTPVGNALVAFVRGDERLQDAFGVHIKVGGPTAG